MDINLAERSLDGYSTYNNNLENASEALYIMSERTCNAKITPDNVY